MRLLITTDTVGGVWTFTQELACGLLERDCSVALVSFGRMPSLSQRKQCDEMARRFGRRFHYVPSDIPLEWMEENAEAFARGAELLEREAALFAPDLIHSNQFCYGALNLEAPRVVTAHSDVQSWAKACRPEPLPDSAWLRDYLEQAQAGLVAASAVVAPTAWMLGALAETFELPAARIVIPNGRSVSPSFNRPRELRAVAAGRVWDEAKGISLLAGITSPIPIWVAGETQFEGLRGGQHMEGVHLLGQLNQLEMMELFRDSSIYLCPSVYEPFGLAPLEAARCGCAVISRDIPSLREVWRDAALYFDTPEALVGILEQLSINPQWLQEMRRRSFERSLFFSRDRMVHMYLTLFQQVQSQSARTENAA